MKDDHDDLRNLAYSKYAKFNPETKMWTPMEVREPMKAYPIDNKFDYIKHADLVDYKDPKSEGGRDDKDKLRYDLIPPEALEAMAKVLTYGSVKYAPKNWEKGMAWGRVFSSMMRHAWAWMRGEDNDPETGFSHMDHVLTNVAFLVTYIKRRRGEDDRTS